MFRMDTRSAIAVGTVAAVVALMFYLVWIGKVESDTFKIMVGGLMTVGFASIIGFYFGSSEGSKSKDDAINAALRNSSDPGHNGAPAAPPVASATPAAPAANSVPLIALAVLAATLAMAQPAFAQLKTPHVTGDVVKDIKSDVDDLKGGATPLAGTAAGNALAKALAKPFQDLADLLNSDAEGAQTLSTQIPALQDGHGQQCWMAMANAGAVFKAHPVPLTFHTMIDIEALRLLEMTANNLCTNVHCTQVFGDLTAVAQAIAPTITGTPLPVPSLHDLCSKIPQVAVVAPVPSTTPATPVPPAATTPK